MPAMGKTVRQVFCCRFISPIILLQVTASYFCLYAGEPKSAGKDGMEYETHGNNDYLCKTLESGAHSSGHRCSIKPKTEHCSTRLPLPAEDRSFSSESDLLLPPLINFCNNWAGNVQRSIFPCLSGHLFMLSSLWAVFGSEDAERPTRVPMKIARNTNNALLLFIWFTQLLISLARICTKQQQKNWNIFWASKLWEICCF